MHWSCPHCGIKLAAPDEALGTGWSFSRCYKCGGFALIRRAEINIIKVDKAPPGERVILPEATEDPTAGLMSENATQKLAKHITNKQKIRVEPPSPPQLPAPSEMASEIKTDLKAIGLPDPLPPPPSRNRRSFRIPVGIGVSSTIAVLSGIYLYIQGSMLWQKTTETAVRPPEATKSAMLPSNSHIEKKESVTNIAAQDSAILRTRPETINIQEPKSPIITDQVQQKAMAPIKRETPPVQPQPTIPHSLFVRIRPKKANIHSGPGMNFPIVSTASQDILYHVSDWNDRWFKVAVTSQTVNNTSELQEPGFEAVVDPTKVNPAGRTVDRTIGHTIGHTIGWIRNDLVQIENP